MALKSLSTRDLRRELQRREAGAAKLQAAHTGLAKRLAQIEAELLDLGVEGGSAPRGATSGRKPGRPAGSGAAVPGTRRAKNDMTLPEAIMSGVKVGVTVSPAQAATAARKAGYKSTSPNFGMMVANTLAKHDGFKRIERGQYQRTK